MIFNQSVSQGGVKAKKGHGDVPASQPASSYSAMRNLGARCRRVSVGGTPAPTKTSKSQRIPPLLCQSTSQSVNQPIKKRSSYPTPRSERWRKHQRRRSNRSKSNSRTAPVVSPNGSNNRPKAATSEAALLRKKKRVPNFTYLYLYLYLVLQSVLSRSRTCSRGRSARLEFYTPTPKEEIGG